MSLGGPEILVILIVALLVFGPTRLPEIGRQLGKAIRELRKVEERVKSEISSVLDLDGEPSGPHEEPAPWYGDPTNVPDREAGAEEPGERAERVETEADDHDAPPPIADLEPDAEVPTSKPPEAS